MADITFSKPTYANGVNALSAATFQPLANAIDEIAHQANRTGILAADTVPGYGIGANAGALASVDLNNVIIGGNYAVAASCTNKPEETIGTLVVVSFNSGFVIQEFTSYDSYNKYFRTYDGDWAKTWVKVWNAGNDGNVGQPPAPKPNNTSTVPGYWAYTASSTTPNVAGAKYAIMAFNAAGEFLGASANWAANTSVLGVYGTAATLMYYRTA